MAIAGKSDIDIMSKFRNNFSLRDVMDFWDSVAERYDSSNIKFGYTHSQRFYEAIKYVNLSGGKKLLNIWSRTGSAILYLKDKFKDIEIINLELSGKFIEKAKKRFPDQVFIQGSLHQLPFDDKKFDCVLSLETLEHVPDPFLFVKECNRVLKSGGRLVMSLPPASAEYTSVICNALRIGHGEGPHKFLPSRMVKHLLDITSFKLLLHKGTVFLPLNLRFLKDINLWLERHLQNTFLKELGIRQFYICERRN